LGCGTPGDRCEPDLVLIKNPAAGFVGAVMWNGNGCRKRMKPKLSEESDAYDAVSDREIKSSTKMPNIAQLNARPREASENGKNWR